MWDHARHLSFHQQLMVGHAACRLPSVLPQLASRRGICEEGERRRNARLMRAMEISSNNVHAGDDQLFKQDNKSLLKSEVLYQYILKTSVYPREPEALRELRLITAKHPWNLMAAAADEVQFLGMLLRLMNAKRTLEIGVFTGYSLLATALALPEDGTVLAIDVDRKSYELGLPVIEKAGVAHKIDFREGKALTILDELMNEEKYKGWFDFVFVDADKVNYLNYHARVMELVKVGGVIGYDNTLWYGSVVAAAPDEPLPEFITESKNDIIELNKALAVDQRIEICQLCISDGFTLCRRLY